MRIHSKAVVRFKARLKVLPGRSTGIHLDCRLSRLVVVVGDWVNYFGVADMKSLVRSFDEWVRRRVCMCFGRVGSCCGRGLCGCRDLGLVKVRFESLHIRKKVAGELCGSSILHYTLTNKVLEQQYGLVSIYAIYLKR